MKEAGEIVGITQAEQSDGQKVDISMKSDGACNLLKTRDDNCIVRFSDDGKGNLKLADGISCSWTDGEITRHLLRDRIEPWLTSLFQSEHLNLLAGSGLTTGVCAIAKVGSANMSCPDFGEFNDKISAAIKKSAEESGRGNGNYEDAIRVATELLHSMELFGDHGADELRRRIQTTMENLVERVLKSEQDVKKSDNKILAFNCLIAFLMSFASRVGTRDRLHIFTTNYDRFIEEAADLAGVHIIDRFVGKLEPIYRSSRMNIDLHYNPPGIRGEPRYLEGVVRLTKLHGSLDWMRVGGDIRRIGLPFGCASIEPYFRDCDAQGGFVDGLMVYPNSAKDIETSYYPYVDLFRDFAAATCRPNSCLVTYGYSFGDDHINRVIRDMLTIPSTHLVIIAYGDPLGRIEKFYQNSANQDQLSILIGPDVADLKQLTDNYMPKAAIDFASQRMSKLLQSRLITSRLQKSEDGDFSTMMNSNKDIC